MNIELTEEESLVLFEFFERFDEKEEMYFVHPAEYIALQKIAGQVCKGSPAMFAANYENNLKQAREKIAIGYEGDTPCLRNEQNYRLYINTQQLYFSTFEEAKNEAKKHMKEAPELRIEILIETEGADFWAYEYNNKQWAPS